MHSHRVRLDGPVQHRNYTDNTVIRAQCASPVLPRVQTRIIHLGCTAHSRDWSGRDSRSQASLQASDALWSLVQNTQAFRDAPRASLYNDRATKEAVRTAAGGGLSPERIPRTMLSLAYIGGPGVWEEEMCALMTQLEARVGGLGSLRAVEDVGRALRRCRHRGDEGLMTALDMRAQELLDTFHAGDVGPKNLGRAATIAGDVMYAGIVPKRLLERLLSDTACMDARDLRTVCSAVVCADRVIGWKGSDQQMLVAALMERIRGVFKAMSPDTASTTLAGLHTFLLAYAPEDDPMVSAAIEGRRAMRQRHTVSTFQKEVYDVLRGRLGWSSCEMEGDVRGVSVDVVVDRERLAIECDGPSHFYRNSSKSELEGLEGLVPSSRLKDALVGDVGWRMVHVDQRAWDALGGREARSEWLRNLFESL